MTYFRVFLAYLARPHILGLILTHSYHLFYFNLLAFLVFRPVLYLSKNSIPGQAVLCSLVKHSEHC